MAKVVFLFVHRLIELRNLQEPFIWTIVPSTISSTMSRQKRTKVTGMTTVKNRVNYSGGFEDAVKFKPMESFQNGRCLCVFVSVCDNSSKCVLNTLQFLHVKTG